MSFILTVALGALSFTPEEYTNQFFNHPYTRSLITQRGVRVLFGTTAALFLARKLNSVLNNLALNNWRFGARGKWQWPQEVAVVTGGCGGVGKELVIGLRARDVKVAILDIIPPPAEFHNDPSILYVKTDLTSPEDINEAAEQIRDKFGHPSILINNAGLAAPHTILETPPEFLKKIFGVNAIALWLTTQAFLPSMIAKNKGYILNVNSITSYMALPRMIDYCASKAGGLTFHEGLNCELKTKYKVDGIITTIIQPSWIKTPMSPNNADEIERQQGKMLTPGEVAQASLEYIWARKGGQVVLPQSSAFFTTLQGWPNWAQELLRDVMGRASIL